MRATGSRAAPGLRMTWPHDLALQVHVIVAPSGRILVALKVSRVAKPLFRPNEIRQRQAVAEA
jgi:hypothetical protein